ncbi:response regulator [Candidatus Woesearchaeota archaeon]|nr:response regulator [Candidatus Woesearchaeota archaeon]
MSIDNDSMNKEQTDSASSVPRVLVVDDEPQLLRLYSRILGNSACSYGVVAYSQPEEALTAIENIDSLAVVVSDVQMPRMNGDELVTAARMRRPDITYFLMTGNPVEYARLAASGIARKVFQKPFKIEELEFLICQQLEKTESPGQSQQAIIPYEGQPVEPTVRYESLVAARELLRQHILAHTVGGRYSGEIRWLDTYRTLDAAVKGTEPDPAVSFLKERKN